MKEKRNESEGFKAFKERIHAVRERLAAKPAEGMKPYVPHQKKSAAATAASKTRKKTPWHGRWVPGLYGDPNTPNQRV